MPAETRVHAFGIAAEGRHHALLAFGNDIKARSKPSAHRNRSGCRDKACGEIASGLELRRTESAAARISAAARGLLKVVVLAKRRFVKVIIVLPILGLRTIHVRLSVGSRLIFLLFIAK